MTSSNKSSQKSSKRRPPARTPEAREQEVAAAAVDLAEKQIREGTASSQVITHFLKLATKTEKLKNEILAEQNKLIRAKTEAIESQKRVEELYSNALSAMKSYQGQEEVLDD